MKDPLLKIRSSRIIMWFLIWIVAILGAGEFALSQGYPWKFSRLEPFFLRSKSDDYVHNAFVIERIREADHPTLPLYIFIGSSAAREAILEDAYLEDAYEAKTGKRIEMISVCTSATSLSDDAKATEAIGPADAVFLVVIDPLRFSQNAKFQLERPMKKGHINTKYFFLTPPRTTVQTLSDYGFPPDLKQRLRLIRTASTLGEILKKQLIYFCKTKGKLKSFTYERHLYKKRPPVGPEDREIYSKKLANFYRSYRKNSRLNVELISGQIDIALKHGNRVILVDLPCNPLFDREMGEFYTHYDKMIDELVRRKKIGHIDMRSAAVWSPDDFVDVHHLRVSGQEKFSKALADILGDTPQLP